MNHLVQPEHLMEGQETHGSGRKRASGCKTPDHFAGTPAIAGLMLSPLATAQGALENEEAITQLAKEVVAVRRLKAFGWQKGNNP